MIRCRFIFGKNHEAVNLSFLKQIEYFKDFFISNFELHNGKKSKFSFGPALPFGYESESEYVDVFMNERMNEDKIKIIIEKNLVCGYWLVNFKTIPVHFPSVESVTDAVEYEVLSSEKINENYLYDINENDKKFILKNDIKEKKLNIILKKGIAFKVFTEKYFNQIKFEKIIRKKLYWQDVSGSFKVI